jgi:thiol:disulfide interchange protein DsbC
MLKGVAPDATNPSACANAQASSQITAQVQRNLALGQKHRVEGTPAIFFEDGKRVPGAMSLDQIEAVLRKTAENINDKQAKFP